MKHSYLETFKGSTFYKVFILVSFIFALILHTGRNRPIHNVSTTTTTRRTTKTSTGENILQNAYPFNTTIHKDTAQTAWCVLDNKNLGRLYAHFPHTLQIMSRCWSFFMMERRKYDVKSCGLYFNVIEKKDFYYRKISPWAKDLISAMNCTTIVRNSHEVAKPPEPDDYFHMEPTTRWFEEVEDVAPLQEAVLQKREGGYTRLDQFTADRTLSIGLIQRFPARKECERKRLPHGCGHYREFINLEKIQAALAENFPSAKIRNTKLKKMNLVEQASWWWNSDVVIAAHGATLSNVMFMRPGTAVIEVFPTDYERMMFQLLMNDVGVYGYPILNATPKDVKGYKNRDVPLAPNVDEIIRLVQEALQRRQSEGIEGETS